MSGREVEALSPRYAIRFLRSDPFGRAGHTSSTTFATRDEAEEIRRACPNVEHMEVVEVQPDTPT